MLCRPDRLAQHDGFRSWCHEIDVVDNEPAFLSQLWRFQRRHICLSRVYIKNHYMLLEAQIQNVPSRD